MTLQYTRKPGLDNIQTVFDPASGGMAMAECMCYL